MTTIESLALRAKHRAILVEERTRLQRLAAGTGNSRRRIEYGRQIRDITTELMALEMTEKAA